MSRPSPTTTGPHREHRRSGAPERGAPVGVLLLHGISSTPASMQPWADRLSEAGHDVSVPLLPGHGTRWQDLRAVSWRDWVGAARDAADALLARHGRIAVGGLSMGGALALALAEDPRLRESIAALMLVNPAVRLRAHQALAVPVLRFAVPSIPAIASDIAAPGITEEAYERVPTRAVEQLRRLQRDVRRHLDEVRCPVLLATSAVDHVVDRRCSDLVAARVSGPVARLDLERSFHVATLDHDAPRLFEASVELLDGLPRT